jgi:hypothetical protein
MNAAHEAHESKENSTARKLLATLKSGAPLKGIVRSHSKQGSADIAWISIDLPMLGERQILVKDEPQLKPGQKVVLHCVPDPMRPQHFAFHLAEAGPLPELEGHASFAKLGRTYFLDTAESAAL